MHGVIRAAGLCLVGITLVAASADLPQAGEVVFGRQERESGINSSNSTNVDTCCLQSDGNCCPEDRILIAAGRCFCQTGQGSPAETTTTEEPTTVTTATTATTATTVTATTAAPATTPTTTGEIVTVERATTTMVVAADCLSHNSLSETDLATSKAQLASEYDEAVGSVADASVVGEVRFDCPVTAENRQRRQTDELTIAFILAAGQTAADSAEQIVFLQQSIAAGTFTVAIGSTVIDSTTELTLTTTVTAVVVPVPEERPAFCNSADVCAVTAYTGKGGKKAKKGKAAASATPVVSDECVICTFFDGPPTTVAPGKKGGKKQKKGKKQTKGESKGPKEAKKDKKSKKSKKSKKGKLAKAIRHISIQGVHGGAILAAVIGSAVVTAMYTQRSRTRKVVSAANQLTVANSGAARFGTMT